MMHPQHTHSSTKLINNIRTEPVALSYQIKWLIPNLPKYTLFFFLKRPASSEHSISGIHFFNFSFVLGDADLLLINCY